MLGKLFKYEWRSISKLLLPIHGFVLLFALLSRFYFTISGGTDALLNTDSTIIGTLTMLLIFALVIVISSIAIFTYIYSGYHFYKNVFTDQGYLTNTLPVTPSQLLLSKELAALLWLLIDVVVISISILFFSITLGNLASSHKVLASIGAYVGIYVVQQIFGLIQLVVWGYFGSTTIMRVNIYSNNYSFGTFLNPILITGLIFNIILIAVCWMGSKYIMTKRLNLQ